MMRLLGARVLVLLPEKATVQEESTGYTYQEKRTASGLYLATEPDAYNVEVATRGIVMQLGEKSGSVDIDDVLSLIDEFANDDHYDESAKHSGLVLEIRRLGPAPFDVEVGDCVIFAPSAGERFDEDGHSYAILEESQIVGVLTPKE